MSSTPQPGSPRSAWDWIRENLVPALELLTIVILPGVGYFLPSATTAININEDIAREATPWVLGLVVIVILQALKRFGRVLTTRDHVLNLGAAFMAAVVLRIVVGSFEGVVETELSLDTVILIIVVLYSLLIAALFRFTLLLFLAALARRRPIP